LLVTFTVVLLEVGQEAEHIWYVLTVPGEVYVWDMRRRTCCHKFIDDGCGTRGTSLAVSASNQYLAAG